MLPYDQIPRRLIQAFVASEDKNFFDHHGFDVLATIRAAFQDAIGYHIRGASTLTQQTAKAILITAIGEKEATARKLSRKIKELILARRLEASLSKEEILYLYLNHVYLGHHAYGVRAAAENYYHKEPAQLTLAEMALIAGLAPGADRATPPFAHPESARKRRGYVLRRMADVGMITEAERAAADAEPIKVYPMEDLFHDSAPFFAEQVRRDVVSRYGNDRLLTGGLRIDSTLSLDARARRRGSHAPRGSPGSTSGRATSVRSSTSSRPRFRPSSTEDVHGSSAEGCRRASTTWAWSRSSPEAAPAQRCRSAIAPRSSPSPVRAGRASRIRRPTTPVRSSIA